MNYTLLRTVVRPGETLFLYTDGVNEAMNAEGDVYSNEAMFRALASSPSREPSCVSVISEESANGPSPLMMEESKLARTISLFIR